MKRPGVIAAAVTAAIALLCVLLLHQITLAVNTSAREWPPRHDGEIALAELPDEEHYFDVVTEPAPAAVNDPSPAHNPEVADNKSEAAPQTGHSVADRGKAGDAPRTVTSARRSDVKMRRDDKPAKPAGPSKEELAREEARRRATAATANAFNRAKGHDNTTNRGAAPGNSGSPSGGESAVNGSGTGTAGGGWVIPRYARVPSTVTGSIKMTLKIDRNGQVTSLTFSGGQPPAATDAALRRAVEREVRSRRFTRTDGSVAPESATAYITYTFR